MKDRSLKTWTAALILAVIIITVFGRLMLCDFTWWDDNVTIHQNPLMNPVQLDTFTHYWLNAAADIYIPLTYNGWAIVSMLARTSPNPDGQTLNPILFHGLNVVTHMVGGIGVFVLLRRLLGHNIGALFGAVLWAVHPVQVESVGWISGYKDVLSGTLAIWSAERFVAARQGGRKLGYLLAWGMFVLAMLAKPAAMTLPLVIAAIDLLALRTRWRQVAAAVLPYLIAALPIMLVAKYVQPASVTYSPLWARPLLVADSIAYYLAKVAIPLHYALDYGRSPRYVIETGAIWYTWLLPAAVALLLLLRFRTSAQNDRQRDRFLLLSACIFVLAPLSVLGLVRFDFQDFSTVADHYLYVAMLGPGLMLGWMVARVPRAAVAGMALLLIAYAARSATLTSVWASEATLMSQTLAANPRSYIAYINLANYYARTGRIDAEGEALHKAAELNSSNPLVPLNLASYSFEVGQPSQGLRYLRVVLQMYFDYFGRTPDVVSGYVKIADFLIQQHRLVDAERFIDEGINMFPETPSLLIRKTHIRQLQRDPNFIQMPPIELTPSPATTRPMSGPAR